MSEILRLIAGGLLALVACYIGVLIKRRYAQRHSFYRSACDFSKRLSAELSTLKTPVPEVVRAFLNTKGGVFESVLQKWLESASGFDDKFKEYVMKITLLKADEKQELKAFFEPLGRSVLQEQLAHIGYFQGVFEKHAAACEAESKRLGGMYFKLCVLLGLALLLLLA